MKNGSPVIIARKRKKKKHAHHGGTWKIAYADFMTAMMAFFLVMWLLSQSTEMERELIADYFRMPLKPAMANGDKTSLSESVIPGGGEDLMMTKRRSEAWSARKGRSSAHDSESQAGERETAKDDRNRSAPQ